MAAGQVDRTQPAVRRQRPAHRTRRADLRRAGDRQPDQRAGPRHRRASRRSAPRAATSSRPTTSPSAPTATCTPPRCMDGRVSVRDSAGRTRVLRDDLPCAQRHHRAPGPAVRQRVPRRRPADGARPLDGGDAAILLDNLPSPNAMEVGPDGLLYYPVMTANEIWRIDPDGGEPQRVAGDLGVPDAVKFDADGLHRVDPGGQRSGAAHRSAHRRENSAGATQSGARQPDVRR